MRILIVIVILGLQIRVMKVIPTFVKQKDWYHFYIENQEEMVIDERGSERGENERAENEVERGREKEEEEDNEINYDWDNDEEDHENTRQYHDEVDDYIGVPDQERILREELEREVGIEKEKGEKEEQLNRFEYEDITI